MRSLLLTLAARQAVHILSERGLHGYPAIKSAGCNPGLSAAPQHACKVLQLRNMH